MKRFAFSLDPLLKIKEQFKQQLELRGAFLHRRLENASNSLHALHESLDGYRDELNGAIKDDTNALQFMLQRQSIEIVIAQIDRDRIEIQDIKVDQQQVLGEIRRMSTEIEALQLLRENKVLEYKKTIKRHSLESLNELILRQQTY